MGYIFMTLAALMFGLNGSVTKVVVETGMSPAVLTFYRVLGTAVIAGVALLVSNRGAFRITWARLAVMTLLGVAGVALMQFAYAAALALLPVGIVLLFQYTAVLMIPLVAFFILRQGVRTRLWIAVALVIVGLAVVAQVWASALNPFGIALALVAAIALAIYYLVGERVLSTTPPLAVAFWTMLFASAFWALFSGWWQIDHVIFGTTVSLTGNLAAVKPPFWLLLIWVVVAGSFLPYLFSFLALRHLSATAASIVGSVELVFAFLIAWFWLGEGLGPVQTVGAVVVGIGITLAQTARTAKVTSSGLDPVAGVVGVDTVTVGPGTGGDGHYSGKG